MVSKDLGINTFYYMACKFPAIWLALFSLQENNDRSLFFSKNVLLTYL